MTGSAPEVEGLAEGLWRRLRDVVLAERRIERFTFAPETPDAARPSRLAALADDGEALADLTRDITLRALAAAADGTNYRLLACLGGEPVDVDDVARALGLPALAVSERVNALAQLGLAARDLAQDRVAETLAGREAVRLVESVRAALAARCRAGLRNLL